MAIFANAKRRFKEYFWGLDPSFGRGRAPSIWMFLELYDIEEIDVWCTLLLLVILVYFLVVYRKELIVGDLWDMEILGVDERLGSNSWNKAVEERGVGRQFIEKLKFW